MPKCNVISIVQYRNRINTVMIKTDNRRQYRQAPTRILVHIHNIVHTSCRLTNFDKNRQANKLYILTWFYLFIFYLDKRRKNETGKMYVANYASRGHRTESEGQKI